MAIKKVVSIICIFLLSWQGIVYATPFRCDLGSVYADKNSCDTFCSGNIKLPCEEIEPSGSGTPCDTANYRGFVYIDGKTFAITKNSVTSGWAANAAVIRNDIDNLVIAGILKAEGVQTTWMGASDPFKISTAYDSVDASRFKWKDGSSISYSTWKENQPDNAFNSGAVGVGSLYGEYWAVIDNNGEWSDVGLNSDGSEKLFPAVVEWSGALSCVAGKEKDTSSLGRPSGMVCVGGENSDGISVFNSCSSGIIFNTSDTGYLCNEGKTACINDIKKTVVKKEIVIDGLLPDTYIDGMDAGEQKYDTGGGWVTETASPLFHYNISNKGDGNISVYVERKLNIHTITSCYGEGCIPGDNSNNIKYPSISFEVSPNKDPNLKIISSQFTVGSSSIKDKENADFYGSSRHSYKFTAQVEEVIEESIVVCPHSGRPCIDDGGGYYCSPNDCSDGASSGNYQPNPDETQEGANDANNDGAVDSSGNCLGRITIFPGVDSRCRQPGTQSSQFQCCKVVEPGEANKPDFHLPKLAVAAMLYFTGFAALAALFALVGPDGFDFKVCSAKERQLWVNRGNDLCYDLGSYCAEKWQGSGCVQRKKTFCCFDSEFSRAFNEAGMEMLGRDWGSAENPKCGGFTPEELQTLSAMNISEHPKMRGFADKLGEEYADKMQKEFNKTFNKDAFEGKVKQQIEGLQP